MELLFFLILLTLMSNINERLFKTLRNELSSEMKNCDFVVHSNSGYQIALELDGQGVAPVRLQYAFEEVERENLHVIYNIPGVPV